MQKYTDFTEYANFYQTFFKVFFQDFPNRLKNKSLRITGVNFIQEKD